MTPLPQKKLSHQVKKTIAVYLSTIAHMEPVCHDTMQEKNMLLLACVRLCVFVFMFGGGGVYLQFLFLYLIYNGTRFS